jgi:hypothetical protein
MISVSSQVTLDRFDERYNQIVAEIEGAMERAGDEGVKEAKRRSRVSKKIGVHMRDRNEFARIAFLHYELRNLTPYAPFLNFGTRRGIVADHFFDIAAGLMIRTFLNEVRAIPARIR